MKTKKLASFLLAFMLVLSLLPANIAFAEYADSFAGGTGTESDPYLIETLEQLELVRQKIDGWDTGKFKHYKLIADIDMSSAYGSGSGKTSWKPIAHFRKLYGSFDGNNHKITGLYMNFNGSKYKYCGLFGEVCQGTIKNLTVSGTIENLYTNEDTVPSTGGIVGYLSDGATISNCVFEGNVSGYQYVGGVVGRAYDSKIENCCSFGTVKSYNTSGNIGGIVGFASVTHLSNCFNAATVSGGENVGGIAGAISTSTVENCYNLGAISGDSNVGGIVGWGRETLFYVEKCFNKGTVTATETATAAVCSNIVNGTSTASSPVSSCYYPASQVYGGDTYSGATAINDEQFKTQETFSSWDFKNTWIMTEEYPVLLTSNIEDGSKTYPYKITSLDAFKAFRDKINTDADRVYAGKNFILTTDIDLANSEWEPIGVNYSDFEGIFDGKGHTISNLQITTAQNGYNNNLTYDYQGLFGVLRGCAEVKNLTVKGKITLASGSMNHIGGVVGLAYEDSHISNVTSYVNITDGGTAYSNINNVGGVVGKVGNNNKKETAGHINNCKYYGTIDVNQSANVGGIVGCAERDSFITNNANYGSINGILAGHIAGVAGAATVGAHVLNCANYGNVSNSHNDCNAGVVGYANEYVTINNCLNAGNVSAKKADGDPDVYVGGILGYQNNSNFNGVTNCFNYGKVTATDGGLTYTGAIVGYSKNSTSASRVNDNYYLKDSSVRACGGNSGNSNTEVTAAQAESGEIAYKLQGTQEEQVWGQTLKGENKSSYPALGCSKVYKITFVYDNAAYATMYANSNGVSALPQNPCENFALWLYDETNDEAEFTANTTVSSDMTVFAISLLTISNANELKTFRDSVNNGNHYIRTYVLMTADIDLCGNEENQWTPIDGFYGFFDGGGHKISGLYINSTESYNALFGSIISYAKIKNLSVSGEITGFQYIAGIATYNYGTIENCYNECNIKKLSYESTHFGGLAAYNVGTIKNCYNIGNISGGYYYNGGIAGENSGTIENCYNSGYVKGTWRNIGAITGNNQTKGTINNCYYLDGMDSEDYTDNYGTALSAEQMKNSASFNGWDFNNTWIIEVDRPLLRNNLEIQKFEIKSVTMSDTQVVTTLFIPEKGTYTLVFADYEGNKLNNVKILSVTADENNLGTQTITENINLTLDKDDKVMLLDGLANLTPKCAEYVVK